MRCRYCGAELVPGAMFCANCGKPIAGASEFSSYEYNSNDQPAPIPPASATPAVPLTPVNQQAFPGQQPPAQPSPPTQSAQQPFAGQQGGANPQWPPFQGQQGNAHTQWPPFQGQQPAPNMPPYQPQQQTYSNPQLYQGAAPPFNQGFPQPAPGTLPQVPQPPTAPPRKSGLSPAMVVLLIVLALLVGGGGVFAYYTISHHNAPPTQTITPTPTTPATTPSPTVPTITATDPQQLYTQATSGTPTLNDPLNSSNPSGWQEVNSSGTCTFPNKTLQLSAPAATSGQFTEGICLALGTSFSDFAYEVNTTIAQGNITGIVFRADPFAKSVYLFGVGTNEAYVLVSNSTDSTGKQNSKIISGGISQAIHTGANQSNLLTVIARGSTIDLYANQQYLASVTDSTASGGLIGVFGENTQGGAMSVSFSSIKVWQV